METQSRILAWRIAWTEEPGGLQSTWLQRALASPTPRLVAFKTRPTLLGSRFVGTEDAGRAPFLVAFKIEPAALGFDFVGTGVCWDGTSGGRPLRWGRGRSTSCRGRRPRRPARILLQH